MDSLGCEGPLCQTPLAFFGLTIAVALVARADEVIR
jgi:hypothetical protein